MASYNRVILVGNLTRDPELRYISTGTAVSELGLATNNRRKNANGEWIDEPVFVDVTLWGRTAETASEYLTKGSSVLIEGHLKFDTWETDGQKRSKLRVVCDHMQMLGGRSGPPGEGGARPAGRPAARPAAPRSAPQYSQDGPPDDGFEPPPPEPMEGGGDGIPF
jgi:single-strand DNA-binding protein